MLFPVGRILPDRKQVFSAKNFQWPDLTRNSVLLAFSLFQWIITFLTDLEKSEHKNASYNYKSAPFKYLERLRDQKRTRYFA